MMTSSAGKIVTFYSYKGGTGRSMALANVAWVLASAGARVLVVDWDLEAPGLHRYFRPFLADKDLVRHESEGLIDFMIDFTERMATPDSERMRRDERWIERRADIGKWSKQLLWPSGEDAETRLGGRIHFVPAGRQGPAYARRVNSFDWSGFYEKYSGGAFIDAVRRSMTVYDWVLIDSRTGVSDTAGICTTQLPDTLVVCFTLNYQSIDGAAAVARSARDGRRDGLRILPLPTRLDGSEDKLLRSMLAYAREQFEPLLPADVDAPTYWRTMGIPYFPRYAYFEKLAPFEEQVSDTTSALPAVERLTSYITGGMVTKMEPLPEPQRQESLREFELMPGDVETEASTDVPAAASEGRVLRSARRSWYWARRNGWQLASAGLAALLLVIAFMRTTESGSATLASAAPSLLDAAHAHLQADRRGAAALLVAEAARRLDPGTVIGSSRDQTVDGVYNAFVALAPFVVRSEAAAAVRISPDGQWLATSSPRAEAQLYRFPPQGRQSPMAAGYSVAAFSADSRYLASGGRDGSLVVFETATGRRIWQWDNPDPNSAWVTAVEFAPDGSRLAAGTDTGTVVVAQVDPWRELRRFVQKGSVDALEFAPDSAYVATASGSADVVTWWSHLRPRPVEVLGGHDGGVADIAFLLPVSVESDARRMVTAAASGHLRSWTQTDNLPQQVTLNGTALMLAVSPRRSRLAASDGKGVAVWNTADPLSRNPDFTLPEAAANQVASFVFESSREALVVGTRGELISWFPTADEAPLVTNVPAVASSLAVSPDGRYVAAASPAGVHVAILGTAAIFSAAEVRSLACSQVDSPQLSAADWRTYFGDEPLRYTCDEAVVPQTPLPSALR